MKFGMRKPSLKKRIAAHTSIKRQIIHHVLSFLSFSVLIILGVVSLVKKKGNMKKLFSSSLPCFILFIAAIVANPASATETASAK